jgi:hypothetical protein
MADRLFSELDELQKFRDAHPEVIITYPSDTGSGLWEVSVPDTSTMAFDGISLMLRALTALYDKEEES